MTLYTRLGVGWGRGDVELFIYCTLIFIAGSHTNMAVNSLNQPRKISERKIYAYTVARGCQKSGAFHI